MTKPDKKTRASRRLTRLRERAEALLDSAPGAVSATPAGDAQYLVHELRVQQAELEMQNEELRRVEVELNQALSLTRDRFAQLYDLAPVGYLTLDARGVIREINLTGARLLGHDRLDVLKSHFSRYIAAESQDDYYLHRQKVFATAAPQSCELQMRRPDGAALVARLDSIVDPPAPGRAAQCLVAFSDITERVRLDAERSRLAAIVNSSEDAILSRDLDDIITSWNAGAARMFGYSAAEIVGRPMSTLVPRDRREELRRIRQHVSRGELFPSYDTVRIAKDGRPIAVSSTSSPIKDSRGKIVGISAILRDVTRRTEAEASLHRSEAQLWDFFEESPLGLLWVGADGRILRVNKAQLEILGCAAAEVAGRPVANFHAEPADAAAVLDRLARREAVNNHRVRLRRKDGSFRHVLIDANGLWERGRLVHSRWFVRDITRRVELEREIVKISEAEQSRLGQELHDDVCQQLTGIEFLAHGLELELAARSKTAARQATRIARMIRAANARIRDLAHGLTVTHAEVGGLVGALEGLALRTRQVFRSDCRVRCGGEVSVIDPEIRFHLYRIAQEAVGNAIKHGRAKRIEIRLRASGDRVVLGVHDNGVGFPKTPARGKGMGLRLMQYRAGLISASLVVQHKPAGGTSVVCSVRLENARPSPAKKK